MSELTRKIAKEIERDVTDRRVFGWDDVDDDMPQEIRDRWEQIIDRLLPAPQLTWTTVRPTVPGAYFVRGKDCDIDVIYFHRPPNPGTFDACEFAGPITEPAE